MKIQDYWDKIKLLLNKDRRTEWTKLAKEYTERGMMNSEWNLGYLEVLNLLGEIKNKTIIDYGCGSGKFSRKLAEQGAEVSAFDINLTMIHYALRANKAESGEFINPNIHYQLLDGYNDGNHIQYVPDDSIDAAVSTFVFCGILDDQELSNICDDMYRVLKPQTPFVVLDPHPTIHEAEYVSGSRILLNDRIVKTKLEGMSKTFYDCLRQIDEYRGILESSGFNVDTIKEPIDENKQAQYLVIRGMKE